MRVGLSLASFYPMEPEKAVPIAKSLGFNVAELFINTDYELCMPYLELFKTEALKNALDIYSIHPFTSALENYLFFSFYPRRVRDAIKFYARYLDAAKFLGAKLINMHGDRTKGLDNLDNYIDCLAPLIELADKKSIAIAQENVYYNSINNPEFIYRLRQRLGKGVIKFTLDIKQANKGGQNPLDVAQAMGDDIINVHVNDFDSEHICLLPGAGCFDYHKLKDILIKNSYDGPLLIEVYSNNFKSIDEIKKSKEFLEKIF